MSETEHAKAVLAGKATSPQEALALVATLHKTRQFGLSRKLLDALSKDPAFAGALNDDWALRLRAAQQRALSTYKDPDLQTDLKLQRALDILQSADDLSRSVNQETLGIAGAVYKRLWEHTGRERQLETALAFYRRGYQQGAAGDAGYTGINAALILDLLADLESPDLQPSAAAMQAAEQRREEARGIRTDLVAALTPMLDHDHAWWLLVTLGEAHFGLRDYERAEHYLSHAADCDDVADWERESTARQLATLFRLQQRERALKNEAADPRGEQVLARFLRDAKPALDSVIRGKVGVALSGGGFRASLYHIGVLARLAELDLLRHVEYLSCVSGGSIVGAHYYLEVRKLLAGKRDADITRQDYLDLVGRVCDDFLAGVQRNVRVRIAAEWLTNIKMIFKPDYSRTLRAGELYEKEIYARVADGEGAKPRWLNELRIFPQGESGDFRPKDHNWRRAAKVPILVLNATSLNTGHNWQFTASWMGEPPAGIDSEVDANYRLRRMYYEQAPKPHDNMRLGYAVAASACVPGLFEPLSLAGLYERMPADGDKRLRPVVRLVDGGVHDNQGTAALLEQGCTVLLVSDASGQMSDQDSPSNGLLGVPLRANSILQARVRVSQYEDLESRRRAGTLKGLMFVHLKKDLDTAPVDWIDCQDPSDPLPNKPLTDYGIQVGVQRRLAAIRTDLDSFSEAEAYALMASGYLMTEQALKKPILGFETATPQTHRWKFLDIKPLLEMPGSTAPLQRQLKVADKLAFKVWSLARRLQLAAGVAALLLLSYGAVQIHAHWPLLKSLWGRPLFVLDPTLGAIAMSAGIALLSLTGFALIAKALNYRKTVQQILIGLGMATFGFLFARLHLHVFDRLFLRQGRLSSLLAKAGRRRRSEFIPTVRKMSG